MKLKQLFNTDTLQKVVIWALISVITVVFMTASSVYSGAMDGKKALRQQQAQQTRVDSLCALFAIHQTKFDYMFKEHEELKQDIKQELTIIRAQQQKIYEILINNN